MCPSSAQGKESSVIYLLLTGRLSEMTQVEDTSLVNLHDDETKQSKRNLFLCLFYSGAASRDVLARRQGNEKPPSPPSLGSPCFAAGLSFECYRMMLDLSQ